MIYKLFRSDLIIFLGCILFTNGTQGILLSEVNFATNQRIGIYIGTFDPIHVGHSSVIEQSLKEGKLDYVFVIPNSASHKPNAVPFKHRLEMVKSLYAKSKNIIVPDGEEIGNEIAYSFLDKVNNRHLPEMTLVQIYGDDVISTLENQRNERAQYKGIREWIVMARSNDSIHRTNEIQSFLEKENPDLKIQVLKSVDPGHSSTEIKTALAHVYEGDPPSDLDEKVLKYIKKEGLYHISEYRKSNNFIDHCSNLFRGLKILDH